MVKSGVFIVTLACFAAGCSSAPVREQATTKAVFHEKTIPPKIQPPPRTAATPAVSTRIAADPLNDPSSLIARRSIYYEYDQSALKDEDKSLIQAHAQYLAGHHAAKVRIEGNCDERGSREYNLALGERRAEGVKNALKLMGAADGQIDAVSWGEEKPKAAGHDETAWAQDRRSDIVYAAPK